jgi:hypothetical protein
LGPGSLVSADPQFTDKVHDVVGLCVARRRVHRLAGSEDGPMENAAPSLLIAIAIIAVGIVFWRRQRHHHSQGWTDAPATPTGISERPTTAAPADLDLSEHFEDGALEWITAGDLL